MPISGQCWRRSALVALLLGCSGVLAHPGLPDPAETRRLHALFEAEWEWNMRTFPEWATYVGDATPYVELCPAFPTAEEQVDQT